MAQAADDRAHLPDDGIGDDPRGVVEQAPLLLSNPRCALHGAVARGRAKDERGSVDADVIEVGEPVDVHEHRGTGESEAHGRDEALAAGQHARVGAQALQLGERLVDRAGADVVEGSGYHGAIPPGNGWTGDPTATAARGIRPRGFASYLQTRDWKQ